MHGLGIRPPINQKTGMHALWLGPRTYQETDASSFHGRGVETAELIDLIRREPLILLHGESGHGKSSLLQAGLAPKLREQGALPVILRDLFREDIPDITAVLLSAIAAQAKANGCIVPEPEPGDTLWEYFHRSKAGFFGLDGQSLVPVLILDQFEDLFRRCKWHPGDPETPTAEFLTQFADLLENREPAAVRERRLRQEGEAFDHSTPALRVLISLREDAMPELTPLRVPIPGLARMHYRLRPLNHASAREVILCPVAESPAHAALLGDNPSLLADDILSRMASGRSGGDAEAGAGQSVDPFLLSVVMDQLQRRAEEGAVFDRNKNQFAPAVITHELIIDGVAAALDTFYETAVSVVPQSLREWLETTAGLVSAGGFRNSIAADDAEHALRDTNALTHLRSLENAHLLRSELRSDGSLRFELVHDRLCVVLAGKIHARAEARAEKERLQLEAKANAERVKLEAQAAQERHRANLLDAARKRAILVAFLAGAACVVALLYYFQAREARKNAVKQTKIATAAKSDALSQAKRARKAAGEADAARLSAEKSQKQADIERDKAKTQLKEASRSDTATAQARLAEGKWQEAVAYLGRSIRYDTENRDAQEALWLALRYGRRDEGKLVLQVPADSNGVNSVAFNADGSRIVTAGQSGTARIWDAVSGQAIGPVLKHDDAVGSAEFSADGNRIVTAGRDGTARVWNAVNGQILSSIPKQSEAISCAKFSVDGSRIVVAGRDGTARVWDAVSGQPIGPVLKCTDALNSAAFSNDGSRIVTADSGGSAQVWNAVSGQAIGPVIKHGSAVFSAEFSADGSRIVTAGSDGMARIWDTPGGHAIVPVLEHGDWVSSAVFSADGSRIVTAGQNGRVRVWNAVNGQAIGPVLEHSDWVNRAAFSADGSRIVTAGRDGMVRVWNAVNGQTISPVLNQGEAISSAAFSADGSRIITAGPSGTARFWDAVSGQAIGAVLEHGDWVSSTEFSADGSRVMTVGKNGTVQLWDLASGQAVGTALKHGDSVNSAAIRAAVSADGSRIATVGRDGTARVWNALNGQAVSPILNRDEAVSRAALNADGSRIVTAGQSGTARVWDAVSGEAVGPVLKHGAWVYSAAFSADGSRIVTAGADGTARLWDTVSGQAIRPILKHGAWVYSAAFSSDGSRIVTTGEDGTVQVWSAVSGQAIGPVLKHKSPVYSAAFSVDGSRIITAGQNGTAHVWDLVGWEFLNAELAEKFSAYCGGARLDPQLGNLQQLTYAEHMDLQEKMSALLSSGKGWSFAAAQIHPQDPKTVLVSPRMTMTVRQATTRLIETMGFANISEAAEHDPAHPLLPFAYAFAESRANENQPANPVRAAWLIDYGLKRLPAETTPADLRLAAKFIAKVSKSLPDQARKGLSLLDRVVAVEQEDRETKELRESLKTTK